MYSDILTNIFKELADYNFGAIAKVVFSVSNGDIRRMTLRPVLLKGKAFWQCEKKKGGQVFHENIDPNELHEVAADIANANHFSEINIFLTDKNIAYHITSQGQLKRKAVRLNKKLVVELAHNRKKNYIFCEGMEIPPLVDLGIFDKSYHIVKSKNDKFVQINKFIEIISEKLKHKSISELTIIDFGCGKSYLTFIIYYYLTFLKKINTKIIGYDEKTEVIHECKDIAKRYGYTNIDFFEGDISKIELYKGKVDMIITLHACDTATDFALWYAIKNKIRFIYSVPCCQHEVNGQIKLYGPLSFLEHYGLYKERFSAIFTDCIRCEVLRNFGYDVDVVEFVDFSNTPKNAMIRAELKHSPSDDKCADLISIANQFKVSQTLLNLINSAQNNQDLVNTKTANNE
jgi:SAM-dependent methyltransferase